MQPVEGAQEVVIITLLGLGPGASALISSPGFLRGGFRGLRP